VADGGRSEQRFRSAPLWLSRIRDCLLVIPGEPAYGVFKQLRGVFLKRGQIMEGVDPIEGTGVNETHKQVTNVSPVLSLIEQRIFAIIQSFG